MQSCYPLDGYRHGLFVTNKGFTDLKGVKERYSCAGIHEKRSVKSIIALMKPLLHLNKHVPRAGHCRSLMQFFSRVFRQRVIDHVLTCKLYILNCPECLLVAYQLPSFGYPPARVAFSF
ncbi:hypothetical protein CDAR_426941 [Caerostris darwini]|uniref:Uncharacterized protein n=1 Tax=Caerostris darwini TaxID=1538125 RepID=A0AAV4R6T7_9ARAC|nr:hypothetical protein CDAR_426941 [Caerostris darwini]